MLSVSAAVVLGPICALLSVVMFGCGGDGSASSAGATGECLPCDEVCKKLVVVDPTETDPFAIANAAAKAAAKVKKCATDCAARSISNAAKLVTAGCGTSGGFASTKDRTYAEFKQLQEDLKADACKGKFSAECIAGLKVTEANYQAQKEDLKKKQIACLTCEQAGMMKQLTTKFHQSQLHLMRALGKDE